MAGRHADASGNVAGVAFSTGSPELYRVTLIDNAFVAVAGVV